MMHENNFNHIDFVNRMNEFSGMTFSQSASKSLKRAIEKLLPSGSGVNGRHANFVYIPLREELAIIWEGDDESKREN